MGIFSSKSSKQAKEYAKQQNVLAAAGIESVEAEKARTIAAEQARQRIYGLLGAPGTYDLPGTGAPTATGDVFQAGTKFGEAGSSLAMAQFRGGGYTPQVGDWESRAGILDPEKYAEDVSKTAGFRIQSRRTAEAEQLLAREGPMWDELSNSVYGVINENAATQLREDVRALKTQAARGGTARRTALAEAQQMQAQEASNRAKTDQTWRANLELFSIVRENADNVAKGNYNFVENLPMIRGAYQNTMAALSEMLTGVALPQSSQMKTVGFEAKMRFPKVSTFQRITSGVLGAISGVMSGAQMGGPIGGVIGGALGGFSGATADQSAPAIESGMGSGAFGGLLGGTIGKRLGGIFSPASSRTTSGSVNINSNLR